MPALFRVHLGTGQIGTPGIVTRRSVIVGGRGRAIIRRGLPLRRDAPLRIESKYG
jgi:hypothetical protein